MRTLVVFTITIAFMVGALFAALSGRDMSGNGSHDDSMESDGPEPVAYDRLVTLSFDRKSPCANADDCSSRRKALTETQKARYSDLERLNRYTGTSNNYERVDGIDVSTPARRLARSVGRLDLTTNTETYPCTGTIVSREYVLTAAHCLVDPETGVLRSDIEHIELELGYLEEDDKYDQDSDRRNTLLIEVPDAADLSRIFYAVPFRKGSRMETVTGGACSEPGMTSKHTDGDDDLEICGGCLDMTDFALLKIKDGYTEDVEQAFPVAKLARIDPSVGLDMQLVHHPAGGIQLLTRRYCRPQPSRSGGVMLNASVFRHTCETQPGSSGAPIFSPRHDTILAIHTCCSDLKVRTSSAAESSNHAMTVSAMAALSIEISDLLDDDVAPVRDLERAGEARRLSLEAKAIMESSPHAALERAHAAMSLLQATDNPAQQYRIDAETQSVQKIANEVLNNPALPDVKLTSGSNTQWAEIVPGGKFMVEIAKDEDRDDARIVQLRTRATDNYLSTGKFGSELSRARIILKDKADPLWTSSKREYLVTPSGKFLIVFSNSTGPNHGSALKLYTVPALTPVFSVNVPAQEADVGTAGQPPASEGFGFNFDQDAIRSNNPLRIHLDDGHFVLGYDNYMVLTGPEWPRVVRLDCKEAECIYGVRDGRVLAAEAVAGDDETSDRVSLNWISADGSRQQVIQADDPAALSVSRDLLHIARDIPGSDHKVEVLNLETLARVFEFDRPDVMLRSQSPGTGYYDGPDFPMSRFGNRGVAIFGDSAYEAWALATEPCALPCNSTSAFDLIKIDLKTGTILARYKDVSDVIGAGDILDAGLLNLPDGSTLIWSANNLANVQPDEKSSALTLVWEAVKRETPNSFEAGANRRLSAPEISLVGDSPIILIRGDTDISFSNLDSKEFVPFRLEPEFRIARSDQLIPSPSGNWITVTSRESRRIELYDVSNLSKTSGTQSRTNFSPMATLRPTISFSAMRSGGDIPVWHSAATMRSQVDVIVKKFIEEDRIVWDVYTPSNGPLSGAFLHQYVEGTDSESYFSSLDRGTLFRRSETQGWRLGQGLGSDVCVFTRLKMGPGGATLRSERSHKAPCQLRKFLLTDTRLLLWEPTNDDLARVHRLEFDPQQNFEPTEDIYLSRQCRSQSTSEHEPNATRAVAEQSESMIVSLESDFASNARSAMVSCYDDNGWSGTALLSFAKGETQVHNIADFQDPANRFEPLGAVFLSGRWFVNGILLLADETEVYAVRIMDERGVEIDTLEYEFPIRLAALRQQNRIAIFGDSISRVEADQTCGCNIDLVDPLTLKKRSVRLPIRSRSVGVAETGNGDELFVVQYDGQVSFLDPETGNSEGQAPSALTGQSISSPGLAKVLGYTAITDVAEQRFVTIRSSGGDRPRVFDLSTGAEVTGLGSGKYPRDIMFDRSTMKLTSLSESAYGYDAGQDLLEKLQARSDLLKGLP